MVNCHGQTIILQALLVFVRETCTYLPALTCQTKYRMPYNVLTIEIIHATH